MAARTSPSAAAIPEAFMRKANPRTSEIVRMGRASAGRARAETSAEVAPGRAERGDRNAEGGEHGGAARREEVEPQERDPRRTAAERGAVEPRDRDDERRGVEERVHRAERPGGHRDGEERERGEGPEHALRPGAATGGGGGGSASKRNVARGRHTRSSARSAPSPASAAATSAS